MKFVFEPDLAHQKAAIDAVVDLFAGQQERQSLFTIAPGQIAGELDYNERLLGYANRFDLLPEQVLENLHIVQERNAVQLSPTLEVKGDKRSGEGDYGMDFTVEMETGTGKTYVYRPRSCASSIGASAISPLQTHHKLVSVKSHCDRLSKQRPM